MLISSPDLPASAIDMYQQGSRPGWRRQKYPHRPRLGGWVSTGAKYPSFFWWVSCNYTPQQAECQSGTNISPVSAHSPPTMLKPRPPCCLVSVTSLGSLKCLQLITKFTLLCFHINCENVNWSAGCVADLGRVFPSTPLKSPLYWCVYQSQGRVAKQQQRERGFMQPLL